MKMNLKKSLQLQIFSILLMLVPFVEGRIHTEREKVCMVLSALGLLALIALAVLLVRSRQELRAYQNDALDEHDEEGEEHE